MAYEATLQKIAEMYPELHVFAQTAPELMYILAVASEQKWPAGRVQAAVQGSKWYKASSDSERDWAVMTATNPAQARAMSVKANAMALRIRDKLAIKPRYPEGDPRNFQDYLVDMHAISSRGMTEAEATDYFMAKHVTNDPNLATAAVRDTMGEVRKTAADYGLPLDPHTTLKYAKSVLTGNDTKESIAGRMAQQARGMYPPEIGAAIDRGETVRQWAAPFLSLAAQNLEIGEDQIDLSDPKWQKMFQVPQADAKSAYGVSNRAMTMSEWQATIRTDPTYGFDKTNTAREAASQMATTIAKTFGAEG